MNNKPSQNCRHIIQERWSRQNRDNFNLARYFVEIERKKSSLLILTVEGNHIIISSRTCYSCYTQYS